MILMVYIVHSSLNKIAVHRHRIFQTPLLHKFNMVTLALIFYASYIRKVRGHLFHFVDCFRWCCHGKRKDGESKRLLGHNNANSEPNKAE